MTKEEKLREATALIQGLVPSVMELGVGCRVKELVGGDNNIIRFSQYNNYTLWGNTLGFTEDRLRECYEILGREIHLEDVLLSMVYAEYVIDCDGKIREVIQSGGYSDYQYLETVVDYDPSKPFTNQSEEFYKFIIKTLKQ